MKSNGRWREKRLAYDIKRSGRHSTVRDPNSCKAALVASFDHSALYKKVSSQLQKWPRWLCSLRLDTRRCQFLSVLDSKFHNTKQHSHSEIENTSYLEALKLFLPEKSHITHPEKCTSLPILIICNSHGICCLKMLRETHCFFNIKSINSGLAKTEWTYIYPIKNLIWFHSICVCQNTMLYILIKCLFLFLVMFLLGLLTDIKRSYRSCQFNIRCTL